MLHDASITAPYRATRLANGVRVVSEAMPQVKTASLGVWIEAGGYAEYFTCSAARDPRPPERR